VVIKWLKMKLQLCQRLAYINLIHRFIDFRAGKDYLSGVI